ncbi:MAG: isochorismatase family cysteine hydrolase [Alphaproteobacteria bacterium]|nr:isochorismatase family cysteine hydrolase [Alphaproteobacteria bacterium]
MAIPLLIVDVQNGFINDATRHIPDIVQGLARHYEHVIVTRFINPESSAHRRLIHWDRFAPGSDDTPLAFTPPAGAQMIEKSTYSCVDAGFRARLELLDAHEIHICGIATDNCVLKCAVDLFESGYRPVVLAYACASHAGADFHEWGIKIIRRLIGVDQVIDTPDATPAPGGPTVA